MKSSSLASILSVFYVLAIASKLASSYTASDLQFIRLQGHKTQGETEKKEGERQRQRRKKERERLGKKEREIEGELARRREGGKDEGSEREILVNLSIAHPCTNHGTAQKVQN